MNGKKMKIMYHAPDAGDVAEVRRRQKCFSGTSEHFAGIVDSGAEEEDWTAKCARRGQREGAQEGCRQDRQLQEVRARCFQGLVPMRLWGVVWAKWTRKERKKLVENEMLDVFCRRGKTVVGALVVVERGKWRSSGRLERNTETAV